MKRSRMKTGLEVEDMSSKNKGEIEAGSKVAGGSWGPPTDRGVGAPKAQGASPYRGGVLWRV